MADWSTYRVSDFVLFSPEILRELFASYGSGIFPAQLIWLATSAAILFAAIKPTPLRERFAFAALATAWIFVALIFHQRYFISINWAAKYFAQLFLFESALLIYFGVITRKLVFQNELIHRKIAGLVLFFVAAFVPTQLMWNPEWPQVMLFGWGPEATAAGTIGILMTTKGVWLRSLVMLPALLWSVLAALMYFGLK